MLRRRKTFLLTTLWVVSIAFGLHALMTYKGKPGEVGQIPATWPKNDLIALSPKKPLLIMFAHPRCPCTKASLGELESLVAQAKDQFEAAVLFYEPDEDSEAWSKTTSIKMAEAIPGVRVLLDKGGYVTKRFAAETSGETVVYSADGKLLFSGGITGARGHMGDNGGFDSVLAAVNNVSTPAQPQKTKVFGCEIFGRCTTNSIAEKK